MLSQNTPYTIPPVEDRADMPPTTPRQQPIPEYNEQFIEALMQRIMPRLTPQILYQLRMMEPTKARSRPYGMSLALAIVSLALMIPLTAIVLGEFIPLGGGVVPALIGISVIGLVMVLINVLFNYLLFNVKN